MIEIERTVYCRPTRLIEAHNMAVVPNGQTPTTIPAALCSLNGDGSAAPAYRESTYLGDPALTVVQPDAVVNYQTNAPQATCDWEVGFHAWQAPPLGVDPWYRHVHDGVVRSFWVDWSTQPSQDFQAIISLRYQGTVLASQVIGDGIALHGNPLTLVELAVPEIFPDGTPFSMGHLAGLTLRCEKTAGGVTGLWDFGCRGAELRFAATATLPADDDDDNRKDEEMTIRTDSTLYACTGAEETPEAVLIPMPFGARLLVAHEIGEATSGGYVSVEIGDTPGGVFVPHHGDGWSIPTEAADGSYSCIYRNCGPYARLTTHITDGVHTVWYQVLA